MEDPLEHTMETSLPLPSARGRQLLFRLGIPSFWKRNCKRKTAKEGKRAFRMGVLAGPEGVRRWERLVLGLGKVKSSFQCHGLGPSSRKTACELWPKIHLLLEQARFLGFSSQSFDLFFFFWGGEGLPCVCLKQHAIRIWLFPPRFRVSFPRHPPFTARLLHYLFFPPSFTPASVFLVPS